MVGCVERVHMLSPTQKGAGRRSILPPRSFSPVLLSATEDGGFPIQVSHIFDQTGGARKVSKVPLVRGRGTTAAAHMHGLLLEEKNHHFPRKRFVSNTRRDIASKGQDDSPPVGKVHEANPEESALCRLVKPGVSSSPRARCVGLTV